MCGRARCTLRANDIPRACHRSDAPLRTINMNQYQPSYNVSPGSNFPVVRRDEGSGGEGFVLHCMKWGLIPSFVQKTEKVDHYKMFNARSESVYDKASFRRLIPKRRCLVAVEGFYEWKKEGSRKQPYYIHFKDGRPLTFAALYDSWKSPEGEILYSFTILTTSSSSALEWLHDRMPGILGDKESTDTWLNGSSSSEFNMVLKPYAHPDLVWYPVTPAMGKPSFNGPECVTEIQLKKEQNLISKFFSARGVKQESVLDPPQNLKVEPEIESTKQEPEIESIKQEPEIESIKQEPEIETIKPKPEIETIKPKPEIESSSGVSNFHDKGDGESKSSHPTTFTKIGAKCQKKRDYEGFSSDLKSDKDEKCINPVRKKTNQKTGNDKQPTMFSYFGKS